MRSLLLHFEGYFQLRMATDPDPTDERRGVSGYTFALAGEPDLDAILHFQPDEPGVWQRAFGPGDDQGAALPLARTSHCGGPRVGVLVTSATLDGKPLPDYDGARVQFAGAQILENNGILARNDFFFIEPLHVRISYPDGAAFVERNDWVNPIDPAMPLWQATSEMLIRRQPKGARPNSPEVAAATGLPDASNETMRRNRRERRASLEDLRRTLDPDRDAAACEALETRIEQLKLVDQWWNLLVGTFDERPIDRRARQLTLMLYGWEIPVQGTAFVNEVDGDTTQPWPLKFWMGGWDADAMTAFVKGSWEIPLR